MLAEIVLLSQAFINTARKIYEKIEQGVFDVSNEVPLYLAGSLCQCLVPAIINLACILSCGMPKESKDPSLRFCIGHVQHMLHRSVFRGACTFVPMHVVNLCGDLKLCMLCSRTASRLVMELVAVGVKSSALASLLQPRAAAAANVSQMYQINTICSV